MFDRRRRQRPTPKERRSGRERRSSSEATRLWVRTFWEQVTLEKELLSRARVVSNRIVFRVLGVIEKYGHPPREPSESRVGL
jgi:hypothetical protein